MLEVRSETQLGLSHVIGLPEDRQHRVLPVPRLGQKPPGVVVAQRGDGVGSVEIGVGLEVEVGVHGYATPSGDAEAAWPVIEEEDPGALRPHQHDPVDLTLEVKEGEETGSPERLVLQLHATSVETLRRDGEARSHGSAGGWKLAAATPRTPGFMASAMLEGITMRAPFSLMAS